MGSGDSDRAPPSGGHNDGVLVRRLREADGSHVSRSTSSGVDLAVGPSTVPAMGGHGHGICARWRAARSYRSGDEVTAARSRALPSSANGEAKRRSGR
ncbi:hypothetical protein E2562_013672 [Oryza meyeriana var. granulata]|uniref:Uncharacterized protein n=1 Tax=Oryza meyeriana var. granulata TaxID=110450 RepID=A0A6G1BKG9_9ORYZ|nr:hypothetical protein E2562_013672 [Oryza meyeriana var. granulata]